MEIEEFKTITTKLAQNLSNQALATELLSNLNDGYTTMKTTYDSMNQQHTEQQKEIKSLQDTNMKLFLKVSQSAPGSTEPPEKPLVYDDVVKSLGGSK